jgi:hypothetical protein
MRPFQGAGRLVGMIRLALAAGMSERGVDL